MINIGLGFSVSGKYHFGGYWKGGFAWTMGLVVIAANIHRLGMLAQKNNKRRRRWHQARQHPA